MYKEAVLSLLILCTLHGSWQCYAIRVIDLTYKLDSDSVTWFTNAHFNLTSTYMGEFSGHWLEQYNVFYAEHTGTHIDAPGHLGTRGQWMADDIPMDKLIGPGVVLDVVEKAKVNPNYAVSIDDINAWEIKYGKIKKGSILLMNSGWGSKYESGNLNEIFGTDNITNDSSFNFPSWGVPAVEWVLKNRDVKAFGVDTPSTDVGQNDKKYPVHGILSKNQIVGIEGVGFLNTLPDSGSIVYIGVLKVKEGSGGPARLFATIDDEDDDTYTSSACVSRFEMPLLLLLLTKVISL